VKRAHRDLGNRESWRHGHFDIVNPEIPTGLSLWSYKSRSRGSKA
jgi:hypothetical protein